MTANAVLWRTRIRCSHPTVEPPQCPQLVTIDRMYRRDAALDSSNVASVPFSNHGAVRLDQRLNLFAAPFSSTLMRPRSISAFQVPLQYLAHLRARPEGTLICCTEEVSQVISPSAACVCISVRSPSAEFKMECNCSRFVNDRSDNPMTTECGVNQIKLSERV
jgi:hypothetical protein